MAVPFRGRGSLGSLLHHTKGTEDTVMTKDDPDSSLGIFLVTEKKCEHVDINVCVSIIKKILKSQLLLEFTTSEVKGKKFTQTPHSPYACSIPCPSKINIEFIHS